MVEPKVPGRFMVTGFEATHGSMSPLLFTVNVFDPTAVPAVKYWKNLQATQRG